MASTNSLWQFVTELQDIVREADKRRLSVWVDAFKVDYPELADEILYCAQMTDAKLVLNYLQERDARFAFLKLVPNVESLVTFLMNFINERNQSDDQNNPALPGNVLPIRRRRPSGTARNSNGRFS